MILIIISNSNCQREVYLGIYATLITGDPAKEMSRGAVLRILAVHNNPFQRMANTEHDGSYSFGMAGYPTKYDYYISEYIKEFYRLGFQVSE